MEPQTAMDRPLDPEVSRRRRTLRILLGASALGVTALVAAGFGSLLSPSVGRSEIVTALVDRGPVAGAISASGTVVPEAEQVLSAPADVQVARVVRRPGSPLAPGDPILELSMGASRIALEKVSQDLALKENAAERTRLDLRDRLSDLDATVKVKGLQLENFRAAVRRNRALFSEGLVSQELLKQSELDEARTGVELARLEEQARFARRTAETTLAGLALEQATLRKERDEAARTMAWAVTRADRAGVLTWVADQVGASLRKGDVLARVADLTSFRVDATAPDVHASRIAAGMRAVVRVGEARLAGSVARVLPSVQNGLVTIQVALDEKTSPLLRPNLRVDVELQTERKESVVRVPKGAFGAAPEGADLFVVKGDRAFRRHAAFGLTGSEHLEVTSGLAPGDEVVLTDMTPYLHSESIRLAGKK